MTETPETTSPSPDAEQVPPQQNPAEEIAALKAQLSDAESRAAASKDAQLRAMADLDNVRKRAEREISAGLKFGAEKLLGELLGVSDSLELGLKAAGDNAEGPMKSLVEGMQLTMRQLLAVLEKQGVTQIDPAGQPFNPDLHEAVSMVPSAEVPPNHVLSVMQKGYKLHERLLRPAMVVVARAPA